MKAVIFDLDGTLLDTIDDIADSMNHVLKRHGLPLHTIADYKMFVGDGAVNLVKRATAAADLNGQTLDLLETEYRAEYMVRQFTKTTPYSGIPELLQVLTGRGIRLAVLSNKPHAATLEVIERFFPDIAFEAIIGQRSGYPIKPNPAGVLEILRILGLQREEVLYIGDTGTDMQTALAAGLKATGVLWGFRDRKELEENGANLLAEQPSDVLMFV